MARAFSEIQNGEDMSPVTRLMTQQRIDRYADVVDDHNPLHCDPEFGKTTIFGSSVAHGVISLSFAFQTLTDWLGRAALDGSKMRVTFLNPVRPGETVTARGKVIEKRETEDGSFAACELWVENEREQRCVFIQADVKF